jgi:hypothetical protein
MRARRGRHRWAVALPNWPKVAVTGKSRRLLLFYPDNQGYERDDEQAELNEVSPVNHTHHPLSGRATASASVTPHTV